MTSALALEGLLVFLVDDDFDTREVFSLIFEAAGANVIVAGSVSEALLLLETCQPDILLSDFKLPDGDGCLLLKEVRARFAERSASIPGVSEAMPKAIAVTGLAGDMDSERLIEAGFQALVSKPVELDALVEIVARLARSKS
jgi:CheY-like chemotaxis protein